MLFFSFVKFLPVGSLPKLNDKAYSQAISMEENTVDCSEELGELSQGNSLLLINWWTYLSFWIFKKVESVYNWKK